MNKTLQYGTTAKILHWLIVALLIVQYSIGWLMPDIHGTMLPGTDGHAHFHRHHDPCADRAAPAVATNPSGGAGKLVARLAAPFVGARALAALCCRPCNDVERLDLRVVSRLVDRILLLRPASDAGV